MIVLPVGHRRPHRFEWQRRTGRILPHLFLIPGFQRLCGVLKTIGSLMVLGLAMAVPAPAQNLRVQDVIVTDPWTGAAIGGFDPVAYFVEHRAVPGLRTLTTVNGGVPWQFTSESNRAAFLDHPETYRPAFGGHDPLMVAGGVPVAGHPHLFAVMEGRLYLFRREENRILFVANPAHRQEAERLWPEVQRQLSP